MDRWVVVAIVAVLGAEAPAAAEKCRDEQAIKDVYAAKSLFDRGHYEEALPLWERAYEVCPSPDLLFNMAQAHRMLGHLEQAITLYRSWLREARNPDPALKREIEDRIVELADLLAAQRKTAEKPPTGTASSETRPGERLTATKPGSGPSGVEDSGKEDVAGGPPAPGETRAPAWYKDRWGLVLTVTGVVTMGVGGALFVHGGTLAEDAMSATDEIEVERMIDSAETYRTLGGVALAVGAAVSVAGIVKLVIPERPRSPTADVAIGPGWVVVWGSF